LRPIIQIENLGKRYRIGGKRQPYLSLRDEITRKVRQYSSVLSRNQSQVSSSETDFWALKDVSFSVQPGEAVGIIGRNGAGKSTLLKILSQITPPTKGSITMRGRVASLLEVGTGFHPELTGRENIYLNGAILGMSRREIRRKFDEIVAFSEVEDFIDTPVKRYSSGMYVKLAFAVAAHLEPEILVVDEVLAVGDLAFQEKCLGKMGDISRGGRTVLFVSHNMASITNLCRKAIWLDDGWLKMSGNVSDAVDSYVASVRRLSTQPLEGRSDRSGDGSVRFKHVEFRNGKGDAVETVSSGDELVVVLFYQSKNKESLGKISTSIVFVNQAGTAVFCGWNDLVRAELKGLPPEGKLVCRIPRLPLAPGVYSLTLALVVGTKTADKIRRAATLGVAEGDFFGTGKLPPERNGSVLVEHQWFAES
jgi:homopolymeric O-antigen transport system ATP-binding protein